MENLLHGICFCAMYILKAKLEPGELLETNTFSMVFFYFFDDISINLNHTREKYFDPRQEKIVFILYTLRKIL